MAAHLVSTAGGELETMQTEKSSSSSILLFIIHFLTFLFLYCLLYHLRFHCSLISFSSFFIFNLTFLFCLFFWLLLFCALFHLSPMCVIPSPLLQSSKSVQTSVKQQVPKYSVYQDKYKINTSPTQTRHTGSSADLPMMLAHALQLKKTSFVSNPSDRCVA